MGGYADETRCKTGFQLDPVLDPTFRWCQKFEPEE